MCATRRSSSPSAWLCPSKLPPPPPPPRGGVGVDARIRWGGGRIHELPPRRRPFAGRRYLTKNVASEFRHKSARGDSGQHKDGTMVLGRLQVPEPISASGATSTCSCRWQVKTLRRQTFTALMFTKQTLRVNFVGAKAPRGRQIPPHTLHADIENFRNCVAGVSVSGRPLEAGWLARTRRILRLAVLL